MVYQLFNIRPVPLIRERFCPLFYLGQDDMHHARADADKQGHSRRRLLWFSLRLPPK